MLNFVRFLSMANASPKNLNAVVIITLLKFHLFLIICWFGLQKIKLLPLLTCSNLSSRISLLSCRITRVTALCYHLLRLRPLATSWHIVLCSFVRFYTGARYGSSVPAAPGTDNYGGGPQRGYTGSTSNSNNYHPYRR